MYKLISLTIIGCCIHFLGFSQVDKNDTVIEKVNKQVIQLMKEGGIPGLSLVMIREGQPIIKTYGFANIDRREPVTPNTLFELGSCTKAFTALAVLELADSGSIKLNGYLSDYLPWFRARYKDSLAGITLLQLLHHTSGIPWQTIAAIPESNDPDALEQTIRKISGVKLAHLPGQQFEYATVNYDILALVIEKVTRQPFENYVRDHILNRLQLPNTTLGISANRDWAATGYKISFFRPREYKAPVYKGNYAAGYMISNATDMAKWLAFQMGLANTGLYEWAKATHSRDETVPLHGMSSYAMGWEVSLNGNKEIYHSGNNPNYASYIAFRPGEKTGVAILTNSNTAYAPLIGNKIMKLLTGNGKGIEKEPDPGDGGDKVFSLISFLTGAYILVVLALLVRIGYGILRKTRNYGGHIWMQLGKAVLALVILLPFLYGIWLLPRAIADFDWRAMVVWTPVSFMAMVILIVAALGISWLAWFSGLLFPEKDKFKKAAPGIIIMSILSGISNMIIIILVTSSLNTGMKIGYLVFYYVLTLSVYLLGRRFVQVNLIRFTRGLIYELRIKLIDKIFSTSYQRFEKIDRGRVYTALNDDVDTIGNSTNSFVMLITSIITTIGAFFYLATIALWATALTIFLIVTLAAIYYFVGRTTRKYYSEARDSRNVFIRLINGMIDGFKEISLRRNKKLAYKADVTSIALEYKDKVSTADIRFVNAFLVGESLLIVLLGLNAFAIPKLFPDIREGVTMSFVIVLLYLIGPINGILNSVPVILQLRIAWSRIQNFLKEIPANLDLEQAPVPTDTRVESIAATGLSFKYSGTNGQDGFHIGPIDLEVKRGEVLFIIGGNGSGKTTLAKLLTGLYEPHEGTISINNKPVEAARLGEYFSTVFSPCTLFEKLYDIDVRGKADRIHQFLRMLDLDKKVSVTEDRYSSIDLSGGQRKRLALLQCYLEDSPIYLFDEWAADQDPDYRNFFYRTLLPEMKNAGKIVIAVTHDDHYFDVADKVFKMHQGKFEVYSGTYSLTTAI